MLTRAYSYDLTVNSFGKAKLIVDEEAHGTLNRIVELNKTLTILYENDTKRRIQLCVKIKKKMLYQSTPFFNT
jgi:hypothetical protein